MARTRKTPLVLQMEVAECGAACLAMVLAAHGRWITLEEVRKRCGTSRNGVSADTILSTAEAYGLDADAYRLEPDTLSTLPLPAIIHWNFDHFVVLEKIGRSSFVILDPAQGRRKVDAGTFSDSFTGLALAFTPSADFQRGGKPPSAFRILASEAMQSGDALRVSFLSGLLGVIPALALAGTTGAFVDYVLGARQSTWIPGLIGVLTAVIATKVALSMMHKRTVAAWKIKIAAVSALKGFWHSLQLPVTYYSQRSAGEVVSRIRLGSDIGGKVAGPLADAMPQIALAIGYLSIMALFDPVVMWAALAAGLFNFLALTGLSRILAERSREYQLAEGKAAAVATSALSNMEAYRSMGREELMIARWTEGEDEALRADQRLGFWRAIGGLGPVASGLLLSVVALVVGAARAVDGSLSIGDLVALQMIAGLLNAPVSTLAASLSQLQEATGALMRLADLESHPRAPGFDIDAVPPAGDGCGILKLSGLSFGYAPDAPVLKELDLEIRPGRMYAVMGASGCGKTTLARIAGGIYQPDAGRVTLDGVDLHEHDQISLRRRLAFVSHLPSVFTGSVEENITLWDSDLAPEHVRECLEMTGFSTALAKRSASANMKMQPDNHGFSGGEMQRLVLARALARKPHIIILDETTSALDTVSERAVLDMLRATGAAVLIVTHRPGTAARCDEVITLRNGRITGRSEPAPAKAEARKLEAKAV